mgnify:CR=1
MIRMYYNVGVKKLIYCLYKLAKFEERTRKMFSLTSVKRCDIIIKLSHESERQVKKE